MMKRVYRIVPLLAVMLLSGALVCMAADGAEGGGGRKIWDMAWRIINFLILVALLWKLLADKIKKYFSDRRFEIAEMIETADKARTDAENQFADYQARLKNIDTDIQEIKEAIMGELEGEKQRIIEEGRVVAERIIEQAKWSAEQEILKAKNSLRNQVVDMAGDMASGLVTSSMTPEDQKRLIEEYLDKVGKEQ